MKYLILSIAFLLNTALFADSFLTVPQPLKKAAASVTRFADSHALLAECQKEGPIALEWRYLGADTFNACWVGDRRVIILNASKRWTEGQKISSILFELHNAKSDTKFIEFNRLAWFGDLSRDEYVESIEKCEYHNSVANRQLIDRGIALGYFPSDTYLPIFRNFQEHFQCQIDYGHSALIAQQYDELLAEKQARS